MVLALVERLKVMRDSSQGWLSNRTKAVESSSIMAIFEKAMQLKDVVRLEVGEPDFDTPEHIRHAAKKALDKGFTHYTPSAGILPLREAIAEKTKKEIGIDVDPKKEVAVTAGGSCAVTLAMMATLNPGDEVLISDPAWPYEPSVKLAEGVSVRYKLSEEKNYGIDLDDLRSKISKRSKIIVVNSPNNPTGSVADQKELEALAQIALENDLLVLSDEVYEKLVYDTSHVSIASIPEMKSRTIIVNSFSKTYAMTGWRVGYAIAPDDIAKEIAKLNLYLNTCSNSFAQMAALEALKGPQDCVTAMADQYKTRIELLHRELKNMGVQCVKPKGAFYLFPDFSEFGLSSYDMTMLLLEKAHVSTAPGITFGSCGENHLRLSCANSTENLKEGLRRIERVLNDLRRKSK